MTQSPESEATVESISHPHVRTREYNLGAHSQYRQQIALLQSQLSRCTEYYSVVHRELCIRDLQDLFIHCLWGSNLRTGNSGSIIVESTEFELSRILQNCRLQDLDYKTYILKYLPEVRLPVDKKRRIDYKN